MKLLLLILVLCTAEGKLKPKPLHQAHTLKSTQCNEHTDCPDYIPFCVSSVCSKCITDDDCDENYFCIKKSSGNGNNCKPRATGSDIQGPESSDPGHLDYKGLDWNSQPIIPPSLFGGETQLISINIQVQVPVITRIGSYTFNNCVNLIRVYAPDVTQIDSGAFYNTNPDGIGYFPEVTAFASSSNGIKAYAPKCVDTNNCNYDNLITEITCSQQDDCSWTVDLPYCVDGVCNAKCINNQHCTNDGFPYCVDESCVECINPSDCPNDIPYCVDGGCNAKCINDQHCTNTNDGFPYCVDESCVECKSPSDCPNDPFCVDNSCSAIECTKNEHCTNNGFPYCVDESCVECKIPSDCPNDPFCVDNSCSTIECTKNEHCTNDGLPYCNRNNECVDKPTCADVDANGHIDYKGPNIVPDEAFRNCDTLKSISMPEVTIVGDTAFRGCVNLTTVYLPEATEIKPYAFVDCNINTINFPKVTTVGNIAFAQSSVNSEQSQTIHINLPEATTIGKTAFLRLKNLKIINLPKAQTIGENSFKECHNLIRVDLPELKTLGSRVFEGLDQLTVVTLPKVEYVGGYAFNNVRKLLPVHLPNATRIVVRAIDDNIVQDATRIVKIFAPKCTENNDCKEPDVYENNHLMIEYRKYPKLISEQEFNDAYNNILKSYSSEKLKTEYDSRACPENT